MRERTSYIETGVTTCVRSDYTLYNATCANPSGTVVDTTSERTNVGKSIETVMHDVVTPNWNKCRNEGVIVVNPMDRTLTVKTSTVAHQDIGVHWRTTGTCSDGVTYVYTRDHFHGDFPAATWLKARTIYLPPPSINLESLKAQALHKAWAGQEMTKTQSLVMLGELSETIASLKELFLSVKKLCGYSASRLKKLREVAKHVDSSELLNKWMYLRYALRPLVYDIASCIDAINGNVESIGQRFTSRGYVEEKSTDRDVVLWEQIIGDDTQWANIERISTTTVEVRSGVMSLIEAISKWNTWGFDQPLEMIWELTRLSFAFDWFFDIGKTIEAWTPEYGLKYLASWNVVKVTTLQSLKALDCGRSRVLPANCTLVSCHHTMENCMCTELVEYKYREINPSRSILPRFRVNLDPMKLGDLAIIIKQIVGR